MYQTALVATHIPYQVARFARGCSEIMSDILGGAGGENFEPEA